MNTEHDGDPEVASYLVLDDRPGPAPRISRERALAMVETALAELPPPVAAPKRLAAGGKYGVVAAAVLLGVVGGAAAARWYFADRTPAPATSTTTEAQKAAKPAALREAVPVPAVQPRAATPAPATLEPAEPDVVDSEPAVERSASAERGRAAPEDLLQKANRLRTQGRFREAAQTYSAVSDRYPKTLSSYVAQVAAASIELEHLSQPGKARRLFERALKEHPEGALDLEARQGLATALRDLGQEKAEVEALRRLIDVHPASPAAKRAALRLAELGAN
jgi:tetratricopeptide (TPR) repeat protein